MNKSEFGRGYATCLRQFLNHTARLESDTARYAGLTSPPNYPDLYSEASAVWLWSAGASDHLIDLVRPRRWVTKAEWIEAQSIAGRAREIYYEHPPTATKAEAESLLGSAAKLYALFAERGKGLYSPHLEDAMALDQAAGLVPQAGEWSCGENIARDAFEALP